jgi:steroid 5-alpha reductase family enzyme
MVVIFILAAILFFTLNFGTLINRITADTGVLTIRWNTRLFKKHIRIDNITGITEDKRFINILQKDGRSFRLHVKLLEPDKRRAVRKFLKEVTGF